MHKSLLFINKNLDQTQEKKMYYIETVLIIIAEYSSALIIAM